MSFKLRKIFENLINANRIERLKLFFLSLTFFLIIAAYTIIRDLKNSVFSWVVGAEYINLARIIFILVLIPLVLLYAKFVDRVRRNYLIVIYSVIYAVLCFIFAYFIGHPIIGIANTDQSPYRIFGWLFYFFAEGFSPFVLSVFWAFSNSINTPDTAKKNYGFMVSSSKLGGMFSAGLVFLFLSDYILIFGVLNDVQKHIIILLFAALILLIVPFVMYMFIIKVPGWNMHGYEAVYKVEKKRKSQKSGMFAGLAMLIKYPYVLGMFSMVFFYEVLVTILSYLRVGVAKSASSTIGETSAFLFKWVFIMHFVGFFISLIGTSSLLRRLGVSTCLLLIPVSMGASVLVFVLGASPTIVMIVFTMMKAINFAFSSPVRESLYIPTLKDIKFKSKSWIDAFGSKLAKGTGSSINMIAEYTGKAFLMPLYSFIFAIIIAVWFVASLLLGRRFDLAISRNEVIGVEEKEGNS